MKHSILAALLVITIQLQACPTIYQSLYADWKTTQATIARYGVAAEANPVVRLIGPDAYFGPLLLGAARYCRETSAWRWAAFATWAVQTWAVNTHSPLSTVWGVPILYWRTSWP